MRKRDRKSNRCKQTFYLEGKLRALAKDLRCVLADTSSIYVPLTSTIYSLPPHKIAGNQKKAYATYRSESQV